MKIRSLSAPLAVCGFVGASFLSTTPAARASVVTFIGSDAGASSTDPRPNSSIAAASFDPVAGGTNPLTYVNFEALAPGSFTSLSLGSGVTLTGTDYYGNSQSIRNTPAGTPEALYGYNTTFGGSNFLYVQGGTATFTFSSPINSFGAYFSGLQTVFGPVTLNFNDGTSQSVAVPGLDSGTGGIAFVGFVDAGKQISSVTVYALPGGDFIGVDDVRFSFAPVPEPSTYALVAGAGILGAGLWRRSRRARTA